MAVTITQLSKETGATKQAIRKFCARKHYAKDARGFWIIDEAAEQAIREYFGQPIDVEVSNANAETETRKVSKVSSRYLSKVSRNRIAELEAERDRLIDENAQLRNMVEQGQKANLMLLEQVRDLTEDRKLIEAPQPLPEQREATLPQPRKGVIQRLRDALFGSGE